MTGSNDLVELNEETATFMSIIRSSNEYMCHGQWHQSGVSKSVMVVTLHKRGLAGITLSLQTKLARAHDRQIFIDIICAQLKALAF